MSLSAGDCPETYTLGITKHLEGWYLPTLMTAGDDNTPPEPEFTVTIWGPFAEDKGVNKGENWVEHTIVPGTNCIPDLAAGFYLVEETRYALLLCV